MEKQLWFRCTASKGQFSDEVAVFGKDYQGDEFSFFVNREFVETESEPDLDEVPARLRVMPLGREEHLVLIRLPGQTFGNGYTVTVRESDLNEQLECEPA